MHWGPAGYRVQQWVLRRDLPDLCWGQEEPACSSCLGVLSQRADCSPPVNCCTHGEAPQQQIWWMGELPKPYGSWPLGRLWGHPFPFCLKSLCDHSGDELAEPGHTHSFFFMSIKNVPNTTQHNLIHLHHNSVLPFSSQEKKELQMGILNSEVIGNLPLILRSTPETMLPGIIRSFNKSQAFGESKWETG